MRGYQSSPLPGSLTTPASGEAPDPYVRSEGLEPSRPRGHTDLNRARMPFRHERLLLRAATGIRTRDPHVGNVMLSTPELQPHGAPVRCRWSRSAKTSQHGGTSSTRTRPQRPERAASALSPSPVPIRAAHPYRGHADAGPKGTSTYLSVMPARTSDT